MRPSASLCQSSRYRLLTLLLVLLLGILCAQTVGGSHSHHHIFGPEDHKDNTVGGTPYELKYHLKSLCGEKYVQITPARGRHAINARGNRTSPFALLSIESISPKEFKIIGVKTNKYLCFSRRGRLIARFSGHRNSCSFNTVIEEGFNIMLQSQADNNWYVGFNKHGSSKRGFHFPRNLTANGRARSSRRRKPVPRRHGKKRARDVSRRGGKRRHQHGSTVSPRRSKKRGHRRRMRKTWCFQFTMTRAEQDPSDPRVRNAQNKEEYDPLRGSDVSKLISTPDPR